MAMDWQVNSQAEMEQAMNRYFATLETEQAGTLNAMLAPKLVSCNFDAKKIQVSLYVQSWMVNPSKTLHGGIIATILDFTMGVLSRICSGGNMTPTVSMTVDYVRSLHAGDTVMIEAECTKCGRHLSYITAKAWGADAPDKVISTATASYFTGNG